MGVTCVDRQRKRAKVSLIGERSMEGEGGSSGLASGPPFRMDGCGRAGWSGWKEGEIRQAVEGSGDWQEGLALLFLSSFPTLFS